MPNSNYQKGKTHQEGKRGRGKVMQKICEQLMHVTKVYVFPAWCSSLFTSNISNQLEEETLLSTWNKFCWKECTAPLPCWGAAHLHPHPISEGTATWCQSVQGEELPFCSAAPCWTAESHIFSALGSHCSHSVHLPLHLGWVGGEKERWRAEKKMFMFTQDHYYDTAESHIKASPQAAREGWRREISDCKRNCLPLFFNRRRLAIKQAANIIWFQINHQCYALADTFCEFQGTDKALCCDLEELSSCCDFFNSPTATVS